MVTHLSDGPQQTPVAPSIHHNHHSSHKQGSWLLNCQMDPIKHLQPHPFITTITVVTNRDHGYSPVRWTPANTCSPIHSSLPSQQSQTGIMVTHLSDGPHQTTVAPSIHHFHHSSNKQGSWLLTSQMDPSKLR